MNKRIALILTALALVVAAVVLWRAPRPPVAAPAPAAAASSAAVPAPAPTATVLAPGGGAPADAFGQFSQWLAEYARANETGRAALMEVGVEVARARRAEMLRLIQTDPERALREAVPYAARKGLPAEILRELEQPVTASGQLTTTFRCDPEHKHEGGHPPPERTFRTADALYTAHVYGWRQELIARVDLVLNGVALDDHFAVNADPARVVDAAEAADLEATGRAKLAAACRSCGQPVARADAVLLDLGGGEFHTACANDVKTINDAIRYGLFESTSALRAAQDLFAGYSGPEWDQLRQLPQFRLAPQIFGSAAGATNVPANPANYLGQRRLLLIPAQFADEPAPPVTTQAAENAGRLVGNQYDAFSYGFEQMNTTVTPAVVLPHRLWY
jgi:hypothetical protein